MCNLIIIVTSLLVFIAGCIYEPKKPTLFHTVKALLFVLVGLITLFSEKRPELSFIATILVMNECFFNAGREVKKADKG